MEFDLTNESSLDLDLKSVDRELIKELVELRQLKAEMPRLVQSNQRLLNCLSDMEVKLTEQKALLEAKDFEIAKLKTQLRRENTGELLSPSVRYSEPAENLKGESIIRLLKKDIEANQKALTSATSERDFLKQKLNNASSQKQVGKSYNRKIFFSPKLPQKEVFPSTRLKKKTAPPINDTFADHFPEEKEL